MAIKKIHYIMILIMLIFIPYSQINEHSAHAIEDADTLSSHLDQLLKYEPSLKGAITGVSIRSSSTGKIIYEHLGDIRLKPASNMKLLTSVVALSTLGEDYTFLTQVLTDGIVKRDVLKGNLYIKGKGDPTLLKSDLDKMAMELHKKGIKVIKGDLIGDDTWYDNVRHSIDLPWSDETAYYGAQISALTVSPDKDYDAGTVAIEIKPGKKIGSKAEYTIIPSTDYVQIVNSANTVGADMKKEMIIYRNHGTNRITIKGQLPLNATKYKEWIAIQNPTMYVLTLFKQSLKEYGIKVYGKKRIGHTPPNSSVLELHKSIPLSELLIPFMKLSNNGHAEILVKEMGKVIKGKGSWEAGLEVVKDELPKYGVNPNTILLRDGSGISQCDLIPANEITHLLFSIQGETWFPTFLQSLPIAGMSKKLVGGTLRNRMKTLNLKGNIRAKTGSISTASSLSGYIKTKKGNNYIFSIILNNMIDDSNGKAIEDKICAIIANW